MLKDTASRCCLALGEAGGDLMAALRPWASSPYVWASIAPLAAVRRCHAGREQGLPQVDGMD